MKKRVLKSASALGLAAAVAGTAGIGPVMAAPKRGLADGVAADKLAKAQQKAPDMEGLDVRVANWYEGEPTPPKNQYEEDLADYRELIQSTFNFTIHKDNIGGWGESYTEQHSVSITAGDPIAQVGELDESWFPTLFNNAFCAPLDTLSTIDFSEAKWNQGVLEATRFKGHVFGMAVGHEPGAGIFFNKRLLQEAGYDQDALYDFQKNGTWTWSKFEEVLNACTRDIDGDGEIDTWGMTGFNSDFYKTAVYSSGAQFVSKDADGYFHNEMDSEPVQNAITWANDMWQKYAQPQPDDEAWDYFKASFNKGNAAMRVTEEYAKSELGTLEDEWGFVLFPCPDGQELIAIERPSVFFIPSSYTNKEAEKIAFAFDLYTDTAPGYEGTDIWKEDYYGSYMDKRAVDETLARMMNGKTLVPLDRFVYGFEDQLGNLFIWAMADASLTPAEAFDMKMASWEAVVADQNACIDVLAGSNHLEPLTEAEPATEPETEPATEPATETQPVTDPGTAAPTGDMMPIVAIVVLALASGSVLVALRKKKA